MQYSLQLFQVSFSICRDTEGVECLLMNFGSKDFTSVRMFKYLALHFEVFKYLETILTTFYFHNSESLKGHQVGKEEVSFVLFGETWYRHWVDAEEKPGLM